MINKMISKTVKMQRQRANYNGIDGLVEEGFSYETIASALRDQGLKTTAGQVESYHVLSCCFEEKIYLSKKDVANFKEVAGCKTEVFA
jgi:hypothetical protein